MRTLLAALALLLPLTAFAEEPHAVIEGPKAGNQSYTVRIAACDDATTLAPWALAEGVVDGKRRSVLLAVKPTREHCVYRIAREWPTEGRWMLRLSLGHPPAPATVATLRADGSVERNELFDKSDGSRECSAALKPYQDKDSQDC